MKSRALVAAIFFGCFGALIFNARGADTDALQFINPDQQLGALAVDQNFPVTFVLTNRSDKVVKIVNLDTSCHCTSVQKSPAAIHAHGRGAVELDFNSSRSDGPVTQSVVVETADGQILTAQFSATVSAVVAAKVMPKIP